MNCSATADTAGFKRKQKETCDEAWVQQTTDSSQQEKETKLAKLKDAIDGMSSEIFGKMCKPKN